MPIFGVSKYELRNAQSECAEALRQADGYRMERDELRKKLDTLRAIAENPHPIPAVQRDLVQRACGNISLADEKRLARNQEAARDASMATHKLGSGLFR